MRNLIKSGNYSFAAGSRQITVTGDSFTAADIRLIVNETQKVIITSSMQKDMITSVVNNVITFNSSIRALDANDVLTIEIDYPLPTGLNILNEYDSYRTKVASAATTKGQNATPADTADQMHAKILAITGNVTVTPIQGNALWHDLAYEIAQWNDAENPYVCAVLLQPGISQVFLTGASKYKVSDGNVYTSSQTVTIGANESGRESKITKYIIFRASTPYISISFGSYPNISLSKNILMFYNKNCDYSTLSFTSAYVSYFINDDELKNPIIFGSDRKSLALSSDQFKYNIANRFTFPPFTSDATNAEKVISIPSYCFAYNYGISDLQLPSGLLSLTIGMNALAYSNILYFNTPSSLKTLVLSSRVFDSCSALTSFVVNSGIETLSLSGTYLFVSSTIAYVKLPVPTLSFTSFSSDAFSSVGTLTKLELGSGWNFTINLVSATTLTSANTYELVCQRLVDYRAVPANGTPTLQTNTNDYKCYGTNTQFTKVHHAGETIYVNAVSKVIQSIESDTEMTMTTKGSSTASGLSYGMNKTLTLASAVKTALTAAYPSWQTDLQAKGWTIA